MSRTTWEEECDRLFTLSLDMLCILGFDYFFKRVNPAFENTLGFSIAELLARPFIEFVHPEDRAATIAEVQKLCVAVPTTYFENRYLCKDGSYKWLAWTGTSDVAKGLIYGVGRDITERKRWEEALRQAKEYAEKIIDTANVMIIVLDAEGNIRVFNEAAEEITGYKRAELQGKNWFEVLVPKDKYPYVWDIFTAAKEGELPKTFENPILTKSGQERYISWRNSVLEEQGKFVGTMSFGIDITERRKTEEALQQAVERMRETNERLVLSNLRAKEQSEVAQRRASELEATLKSMADAVFVCDREGLIVDVNEAGLKLLGLTRKAEALQPLVDYLRTLNLRHLDGRPKVMEELALLRALHGEIVRNYEEVAEDLRTHRDIYLLVSAAPIRDQEGNIAGAVEVVTDITRIKELDRLKDQFISVAAHELKTPVTIMKGYAQALLRPPDELPPPRRKMLDAINRGADRIDRIVKDLLDISRLQLGRIEMEVERIDLPELVDQVVDRMAATTTKHHIRVVKEEPVVVRGDRYRLEQVLINLLDNAIRYSPMGGDIDVGVTVQGDEAVVWVKDRGVGIPKEKQEHIFERFYRAHTGTPYDYGGMGVGLYISREIVSRHGGNMWLKSEEGKGSTFYFSLPLKAEAPERKADLMPGGPPSP